MKEATELIEEEPLDIRISDETLAVTMRTPGNDLELALGFLFSEGVIASAGDVSSAKHCSRSEEARANTLEIVLAPGVRPPIDPDTGVLAKRGTLISSACGVCGRASIDDLLARVAPLPTEGEAVRRDVLTRAAASLRDHQPPFDRTGACPAASLVTSDGDHLAPLEDLRRHSAVQQRLAHQAVVLGNRHRWSPSG